MLKLCQIRRCIAISSCILWAGCTNLKMGSHLPVSFQVDVRRVFETIAVDRPSSSPRFFPEFRFVSPDELIVLVRGYGPIVSIDRGRTWARYDGPDRPELNYRYEISTDAGIFHYQFGLRRNRDGVLEWGRSAWSEDGVIKRTNDRIPVHVPHMPQSPPPLMGSGIVNVYYGLQEPSGDLILLGASHFTTCPEESLSGPRGYRLHRSLFVLRSSDGGNSFHYDSIVASWRDAPWGNEGPNESDWVLLPNGEIVCVMRVGSDRAHQLKAYPMLVVRSSDGGRTWHGNRRIAAGVRPRVIRLDNGILVCTAGRPDNNLIFSIDDGHSWTREYVLDSRHRSSGYIDVREISPNRILVVYELHDYRAQRFWLWEPPEPRNVVKAVVLDVNRRFGE